MNFLTIVLIVRLTLKWLSLEAKGISPQRKLLAIEASSNENILWPDSVKFFLSADIRTKKGRCSGQKMGQQLKRKLFKTFLTVIWSVLIELQGFWLVHELESGLSDHWLIPNLSSD